MKMKHLLKNEQGDTNFVSIIVIITIVLIAVFLFGPELKGWIASLFG